MSITFIELAERILQQSDKPLTANEIWELAVKQGLNKKLSSSGKTPWQSLGARLYVLSKDPDFKIQASGTRPQRFYLRDKKYNSNFSEHELEKSKPLAHSRITYEEKDLHPFLVHFAFHHLKCYCKTINHSKSTKKSFGEWVHPDVVGCVFPIEEWDNEVVKLSSELGNTSVKFLSFEIKRTLKLSTLRENFFQTVSNSSWANESYLVVAGIEKDERLHSELARLSASFGIGVIKLDIKEPKSASIIFPSRTRENLDWGTLNKLAQMNGDFKEFIKRVRIDLQSNEIRKEKYDKVLEDRELVKMINKSE